MSDLPYYDITLPMPPSVNAMHSVGAGFKKGAGGKQRIIFRSEEYRNWIQHAAVCYRQAYPGGVQFLTGRLSAIYIFIWNNADRGHLTSDVSNREKCLTDFLEHKFFENDKQIDEQRHLRRLSPLGQSRVYCRIYAIPDRRYDDPMLIFNPQKETKNV